MRKLVVMGQIEVNAFFMHSCTARPRSLWAREALTRLWSREARVSAAGTWSTLLCATFLVIWCSALVADVDVSI